MGLARHRRRRRVVTQRAYALGAALTFLATACGSSAARPSQFGDSAPFGSNDDRCASARLLNEPEDESVLDAAVDCFLAEYEAGRPVTVDIDSPTVEGDSIYHRYRYDGQEILIVEDARADEYGVGYKRSRTCLRVERTDRLPEGFDCTQVAHPGFPEAD